MTKTLSADFPGSLYTQACDGCNPYEICPKCKYLYENGGQCGGCHVFYIPEEDQDNYIEGLKEKASLASDSKRTVE